MSSEVVSSVEFNTSTMTTTVQGVMLDNLPVLARNPFTLALLNPAVVNQYWDVAHRNPFYMWSNGGLDIGGPTGGKNEQLLDGTPLNISARGSYNLPMDAVQELTVQQNAMDSEFGFSAGGTLNLSQKSGTNEYHGTVYYFGRNPALNALANRITRDPNIVRTNTFGGAIGHPIIKNKLFNFFVYEKWKVTQPSSKEQTMPTDAEKNGDFSHALTPQGNLQTIYDPFTTVFDPATSTVTRTPFPGNIIPPNRIDPTAKKLMSYLWAPNNPGDDLSGLNNFKKAYPWWENYYNFSDRVDYNISDKLAHVRPLQQVRDAPGQPQLGRNNRGAFGQRRHHGRAERRGGRAVDAQPANHRRCPLWLQLRRRRLRFELGQGPNERVGGLLANRVVPRACCNPRRASTSRTSISPEMAVPTRVSATGGWCTDVRITRP